MFLGKTMLVKPYLLKDKKIAEDNYLLFEWNVWKSSG